MKFISALAAILCSFCLACTGCHHAPPKPDSTEDDSLALLLLLGALQHKELPTTPLPKADIYFTGEIDDQLVEVTENIMKRQVAGGAKSLKLIINSPGGSVEAGVLFYQFIEAAPVPIICEVDGNAMSMAYYILQSCKVRQMTKRSVLMIHKPLVILEKDTPLTIPELTDTLDSLQVLADAMTEQAIHRMKVSKEYVSSKIDKQMWFLSWEEALKVGAVDEVLPVPGTTNPNQSTKPIEGSLKMLQIRRTVEDTLKFIKGI